MKALAGGACDVGSGEIGSGSAVGIGGTKVGEVCHHGDVILVTRERGEAFCHSDLGETACFLRVEGILRKSKSPTKEDHALWRNRGQFRLSEGFQKRERQESAAGPEKRSACSGAGVEGHRSCGGPRKLQTYTEREGRFYRFSLMTDGENPGGSSIG